MSLKSAFQFGNDYWLPNDYSFKYNKNTFHIIYMFVVQIQTFPIQTDCFWTNIKNKYTILLLYFTRKGGRNPTTLHFFTIVHLIKAKNKW